MTAAFSFGPLGAMTDLVVSPAVQVERETSLSRFTSSGGVAYFQRPRRSARSWTVSRPWMDPTFIQWIERSAHGLLANVYLYDRAAAQRNMIPADLSAGPGDPVSVEGAPMGSVSWQHIKVPVLAGRLYTVSVWSKESGSPLLLSSENTEIGAMPTPDRRGQSQMTFTPERDYLLTLSRDSQAIAGVRVHEGIPDGRFYSGSGTPCQVAVEIPAETYQMILDRESRIDYQVTLREAGRTGHYD